MVNPWKILNSVKKYENPWISVIHHDVLTPRQSKGIYGVVEFKNIAIGIIPIDKDGFTYLVGQYRFPLNRYSWEIPEGGCPLQEEPLIAAKRELKEETGIVAKSWREICNIDLSNSVTTETGKIFVAEDLEFKDSNPEDTEELEIRRIHLDDAIQMALNGEITDSLSLIGLLKINSVIN